MCFELKGGMCLQDLSSESGTASIRAYASYSDGYRNDVTDLPGLNVSSLAPGYLTINGTASNLVVGLSEAYTRIASGKLHPESASLTKQDAPYYNHVLPSFDHAPMPLCGQDRHVYAGTVHRDRAHRERLHRGRIHRDEGYHIMA